MLHKKARRMAGFLLVRNRRSTQKHARCGAGLFPFGRRGATVSAGARAPLPGLRVT
jgi:hypothetical protein